MSYCRYSAGLVLTVTIPTRADPGGPQEGCRDSGGGWCSAVLSLCTVLSGDLRLVPSLCASVTISGDHESSLVHQPLRGLAVGGPAQMKPEVEADSRPSHV